MRVQALLAIAAARPARPSRTGDLSVADEGQPTAWRDSGRLPATTDDRPFGDGPAWSSSVVPGFLSVNVSCVPPQEMRAEIVQSSK
jgi:hypothetical protein